MIATELIPLLNTSADPETENGTLHERRKSSVIGQELRNGHTGQALGAGLTRTSSSNAASKASFNGHNSQINEKKRFSRRKKTRSLSRNFMRFAIKHTWTLPLILLLAILGLYMRNPTKSNIIHRFIFPSYEQSPLEIGADPNTPLQYGKGLWDIAFVSFYVIVLSFTREFIMQELLRPLAEFCGIKSRGKQLRFMEQAYTAIYFGIMGPAGLYVMSRTPVWYFNTRGMYELYPHKTHEAIFKFYYLFQAAYWAQQAIVMILGLEKPRKDYYELVGHHIITLTLIALSYRFHFTYLGIAIYITHDISDFFLALSKSLHYIDCPVVELYFGSSIAAWIYLRHYQNLRFLISLVTEYSTVGPHELNWETGQYKGVLSNVITFGLLAALQALNLFWLYCLLRSAYRFLVHNIAKDDRSDDEESEIEEMENKEAAKIVEAVPLLDSNKLSNSTANNNGVLGAIKE